MSQRPPKPTNRHNATEPPHPPDPLPAALAGVDPITGGRFDSRPHTEWRPEDGFSPTALTKAGRKLGRLQCCARRKGHNGGGRCTKHPVRGKRVCRSHGGALGIGRPIKHGRYSKVMGRVLGEVFDRHAADPSLLDVSDDIALMRTAVERVLARGVSDGDTPGFREQVAGAYELARQAFETGKLEALAQHFHRLGDVIRQGVEQDKALREALELADRVVVRADRAVQTRIAASRAITEAQLQAYFVQFVEVIRAHVPASFHRRVFDAFERKALAPGGRAVTAGAEDAEPAAAVH